MAPSYEAESVLDGQPRARLLHYRAQLRALLLSIQHETDPVLFVAILSVFARDADQLALLYVPQTPIE